MLNFPQVIVSPVIDAINDTTFWYTFIHRDLKGLMNWQMTFEWHEVPVQDRRKKENAWAAYPNPIMSGGLFTINKEWFSELGFYDTGNFLHILLPLELNFLFDPIDFFRVRKSV